MIYKFRQGNLYRGVDPQTAGEELERIRLANDGKLTPDEVLRWAAEVNSPLHKCFSWDTEKAAREHNLFEARQLIKSVVVVEREGEQPQPAYWNVSVAVNNPKPDEPEKERYYQSASVVAHSPVEYDAALQVMLRELAGAQKGLEQLRRLAPRGTKTKIDRATGQVKAAHSELSKLTPSK